MSTLKANTIQPLSDAESVKIRTNAQDSLTVDTSGNLTVRNEAVIDGIQIGLGGNSISTNLRIGTNALSGSANGAQNTALGHQTLKVNGSGSNNTAVGYGVLIANTSGSYNVGVGDNSQKNTNTGSNNTAVGYNSGNVLGSDSGNTCIGSGAIAASNISNSIALGQNAYAATSNSLYLGTASGLTMYMGNGATMAPFYGIRAWVRFVQKTDASIVIRGSGNVNSVVRNLAGMYTISFTTPLPAGYAVAGIANEANPNMDTVNNFYSGGGGGVYQVAVNLWSDAAASPVSCTITTANIDSNNNTDVECCSLIFVG